jgi:hypothetical protein
MKMRIRHAGSALPAAMIFVFALAGCSKEATNEPAAAQAPALPPSASLQMDLSAFAPNDAAEAPKVQTKLNFWNAQVRVAFVNLAVAAVIVPPQTALLAAIHSIPSLQPDGSWIWTFTIVQGDSEVQLRLRALPGDGSVLWQMYITALDGTPPLDHVLWFEGTTHGSDAGDWTIHDVARADDPAVLHVLWQVYGSRSHVLTFESLDQAAEIFGDTMTYTDARQDVSIAYEDVSAGETWEIEWDKVTGAGSLRVPDYHHGERACWDERQNDIICPA